MKKKRKQTPKKPTKLNDDSDTNDDTETTDEIVAKETAPSTELLLAAVDKALKVPEGDEASSLKPFRACIRKSHQLSYDKSLKVVELRTGAHRLTHRIGPSGIARNEPASDLLVNYFTIIFRANCFGEKAALAEMKPLFESLFDDTVFGRREEVTEIRDGLVLAEKIRVANGATSEDTAVIAAWCDLRKKSFGEQINDGKNALIALSLLSTVDRPATKTIITQHCGQSFIQTIEYIRLRPSSWIIAAHFDDSVINDKPVTKVNVVSTEAILNTVDKVLKTPKTDEALWLKPFRACTRKSHQLPYDKSLTVADLRSGSKWLTHRIGPSGIARHEPASDLVINYFTVLFRSSCFGEKAALAELKPLLEGMAKSTKYGSEREVWEIRDGVTLAEKLRVANGTTDEDTAVIAAWCDPRKKSFDLKGRDAESAMIALSVLSSIDEDATKAIIAQHCSASLAEALDWAFLRPSTWVMAAQFDALLRN